ncbi:MAG TPA: DUF3025 domain-containing protein [Usitatibacter sp.]|nr:DUF3025 domain-containing protein [Usitatibacter sp.]
MEWTEAAERLRSPIFAPLHTALARLPADRWPAHSDLCEAARGLEAANGRPMRFVPPRGALEAGDRSYELRIDATGEIETRERNWHDLFNALAWIAFPRAKAAINAQHAAILRQGGEEEARHRGPERDALTLFDEGGVIVASSSPALLRRIVEHEWKELFWNRRAELEGSVRFLAFGHALCEKLLEPYVGITAKTVFVPVDELFFMLPAEAQAGRADALAAAHFADRARWRSPRSMAPLPVLGIPGWDERAESGSFYDDAQYFRPRRGEAEA